MSDVKYYSPDETSLLGKNPLTSTLANAALGNERELTSNSTQDTTNTSAQTTGTTGTTDQTQNSSLVSALTGSTSGATSQNTSGSTAQQTAGTSSQNSVGTSTQNTAGVTGTSGSNSQVQTGQQQSSGSNTTSGQQRTTGNVRTSTSQTTGGRQTITQNADTTALREVLARQLGGATPDMLRAIFEEGAKAAPNLVVAQAGALGARGVGNSPMAQVLNNLNADLTNKAAMLNIQLLSDASGTAGRIADLTKSQTTENEQTTETTSDQVQDLLTTTNQAQMTSQLANMINSTVGQMQQTQTSQQQTAGTQTQATTGQQQQLQTGTSQQSQVGTNQQTQLQNTQQTQNQTANTATAQNQVQTGTQTQHATLAKTEQEKKQQYLNTNIMGKAAGLIAGGAGILAAFKAAGQAGYIGKLSEFVKGLFAQGRQTPEAINRMLAADNLPGTITADGIFDLRGLPDPDLGSLTGSIPDVGSIIGDVAIPSIDMSDFIGYADGGKLDFLPVPNLDSAPKPTVVADNGISTLLSALGFGESSSSSSSSVSSAATGSSSSSSSTSDGTGSESTGGGTSAAAPSNGASTSIGATATGNPNGPASTIGNAVMSIGFAQAIAHAVPALAPFAGLIGKAVTSQMAPSENDKTEFSQLAQEAFTVNEHAEANAAAEAEAAQNAADAQAAISIGGYNGGEGGFGDGNMGESPGSGESSGGDYANGGQIKGPGSGISDSIPAAGPNGQPIRVSHGEYIIPADVVQKFGADSFDKLVREHHVPADMQRAIFGA